jgi:hypothetical protein
VPDPISSSCVSPDLVCGPDGDADAEPTLSSAPAVVAPPAAAVPNSCIASEAPTQCAVSSPASPLAQKFLRNDPAAFIAASAVPSASASPSPSAGSPAAPPAAAPPHSGNLIDWKRGFTSIERHTTSGGVHLSGAIDLPSASLHVGTQNEDGSHGANLGGGLNFFGVQGTAEYKGNSLTFGLSDSNSFSLSSGVGRDIDGDGVPERCFRMSLGFFTLGECDEL